MSTETLKANIINLAEQAMQSHYTCEDAWYNCPLSEEGSLNEFKTNGQCDCGADEHNAKVQLLIDSILGELKAIR